MEQGTRNPNHYFRHYFLLVLFLLTGDFVSAEDLSIFDSRRAIAMSESEKTYRDFYINGGIESGVKPGMILTVKRRITLYDSYRANSPIEMMVDVGRIKIIHTQKGLSVARVYSKFSRKDRTILENDFIMVGDKVDMSTALMESQIKKKSAKKTEQSSKQVTQADFSSLAPASYEQDQPPIETKSLQ